MWVPLALKASLCMGIVFYCRKNIGMNTYTLNLFIACVVWQYKIGIPKRYRIAFSVSKNHIHCKGSNMYSSYIIMWQYVYITTLSWTITAIWGSAQRKTMQSHYDILHSCSTLTVSVICYHQPLLYYFLWLCLKQLSCLYAPLCSCYIVLHILPWYKWRNYPPSPLLVLISGKGDEQEPVFPNWDPAHDLIMYVWPEKILAKCLWHWFLNPPSFTFMR